jgi:hypothetical protein
MDYESPRCNFNYRTRRLRDEQHGRDVALLRAPLSIKAGLHYPFTNQKKLTLLAHSSEISAIKIKTIRTYRENEIRVDIIKTTFLP